MKRSTVWWIPFQNAYKRKMGGGGRWKREGSVYSLKSFSYVFSQIIFKTITFNNVYQ